MRDRVFIGTAALLFIGSVAVTVTWCASMTGMPGMDMAGGWTMSMAWMRMPGQTWLDAGATFLGMWSVMMLAMMLPAVTPALRGHRHVLAVAAAYFGVWLLSGLALYPLGLAFAGLAMQVPALSRGVPVLAAATLLCAGVLQVGRWKARQLECCRSWTKHRPAPGLAAAWRHGLHLGLRCCVCCAPLTAALLVLGVMDLAAMAAATAAISLERLAPRGRVAARISGALLLGAGLASLAGAFAA